MANTLRVGLIGCGVISAAHVRGWRKVRNAEIAGVYDVNRELAQKLAARFGIGRIFKDMDEVLQASDVIDLCTPPHTHAAIATAVIEAGRHLLVEKPFVTALDEWERLAPMIAASNSKVCVVHNLKFLSAVVTARRWLKEGRIGTLIGITRRFLTNPATDRMLVGNGHWSHRLPGGRWFETLPHELYLIHSLVGPLDLSNVACERTANAPAGVPADEILITMQANGCIATIHYSGNCATNVRTLELLGTDGSIFVDLLSDAAVLRKVGDTSANRATGREFLNAASAVLQWFPNRMGYLGRRVRSETPHAAIIRRFADHLQGRGDHPTPLSEVDYVIRKCELIGQEIERSVERASDAVYALESR